MNVTSKVIFVVSIGVPISDTAMPSLKVLPINSVALVVLT